MACHKSLSLGKTVINKHRQSCGLSLFSLMEEEKQRLYSLGVLEDTVHVYSGFCLTKKKLSINIKLISSHRPLNVRTLFSTLSIRYNHGNKLLFILQGIVLRASLIVTVINCYPNFKEL